MGTRSRRFAVGVALCAGLVWVFFVDASPKGFIVRRLTKAVDTGDVSRISYEFIETIHAPRKSLKAPVAAVREFLTHPDPYVRLTAANALFTAGDRSGYQTLLDLVRSAPTVRTVEEIEKTGAPAEMSQIDVRRDAARTLCKYRQYGAGPAIRDLFLATNDPELMRPLVKLGIRPRPAGSPPFSPDSGHFYGLVDARETVPDLIATFERTKKAERKVPIAWALAKMTGEDRWVQYLAEAAQPAIDRQRQMGGAISFDDSTKAVEYLGSLQRPDARAVLERALESQNAAVVRYAVVNLLFNQQEGSERARQLVLRALRNEVPVAEKMLDVSLLLEIASSLDDPEMRAAGEARRGSDLWFLYAVVQKEWPIYNWIDDYVVELNPTPARVLPERVFGARN